MSFAAFRTNPAATVPARATPGSAGYDLTACEAKTVPARGGRALVDTGVAVAFPAECYCRVAPRSGMAVKQGIDVLAGVVDSDYFPNAIKVVLVNHGDEDFEVRPGMRVAQLIFEKIHTPELHEIVAEARDDDGAVLADSHGHKGFGSTGV